LCMRRAGTRCLRMHKYPWTEAAFSMLREFLFYDLSLGGGLA
jgi:hypothetical protein